MSIKRAGITFGVLVQLCCAGGRIVDQNLMVMPKAVVPRLTTSSRVKALQAMSEAFVTSKTGGKILIGGKFNTEYTMAKNVVFLNNNLPDEVGYFRGTLDLDGDYTAGREKCGHDAVKLHTTLRYRGYWGNIWAGQKSGSTEIQVADAKNESKHEHSGEKPMPWMKELWSAVSVDAMARLKNKGTHVLKLGWFPFSFGRGIALGESYGNNKNFLGVHNRPSDYAPAGVLYSGRVFDGRLGYDVYFTKFEDRSTTIKDTMAQGKAHRLDVTKDKAWNGTGNDDTLVGVQVSVIPSTSDELGYTKIAPYCFYNCAKDKQVERPFDSENSLLTLGCAVEYERGGFEFGGEFALNAGTRTMHGIDRMREICKRRPDGSNYTVYEGIKIVEPSATNPTAAVESFPAKKDELAETFAVDLHRFDTGDFRTIATPSYIYRNYSVAEGDAYNRLRPSSKNKYKGWMVVADMAYTLKSLRTKFAVCGGWVSGDALPADGDNRDYKGFVGLNESYSGLRVKSTIFMDSRTVKRPLTFDETNKHAVFKNEDETFSDIQFVGWSALFRPERFKNVSFMSNVLLFWKEHEQGKPEIDPATGAVLSVSTTEFLDRFYGTEWNIMVNADVLDNVVFNAIGGVFFPGRYFHGLKGMALSREYAVVLDASDEQGVDNTRYGMGNNTAYFVRVGFEIRF